MLWVPGECENYTVSDRNLRTGFLVRQTRVTGNMLNNAHTLNHCDISDINLVKKRIIAIIEFVATNITRNSFFGEKRKVFSVSHKCVEVKCIDIIMTAAIT